MTHADRLGFAKGLYVLGETFNEPVSETRADAYFAALADLPIAAVLTAMRAAVSECRFFPRPIELREMVHGSVLDRAELAWLAVVGLVRRFGYTAKPESVPWPDEATKRAALELFGGWSALCSLLPAAGTPEFLGTAKQFKAGYGAQVRRDDPAALPPSPSEARAQLANLESQLRARGLPTGGL